jgi:PAS domain S-box-containing protein
MRITQWTRSAERMFGWKAEEVIGKKMGDFHWIYEDDQTRVEQVAAEMRSGGHAGIMSANRNYRKNGTILFCEWYNSSLLDDSGRMRSLLSLVLDVSERIRLHEELVTQTQELFAANRLKDDFLVTLSHELRTPINAVLGWAQILNSANLTPERVKKGLDTITRNAKLQAHMVDDLLDVSHIITGGMRLDVQPVDVWTTVDDTLESLRPAAEAKGLQISCNVERGLTLAADPMRLQQVLWNLLSNAVKFTASGGSIRIRAHLDANQVAIVVSDTGIGIPSEFLPHVFERFRQADSSTTREHRGLGIGLAIVRHIVELHGGTVEARSEGTGRGATFTVRLPLRAVVETSLMAMPA